MLEITTEAPARLSSALTTAKASSAHATRCWTQFVAAVEDSGSAARAHRELVAAVAEQTYAWAVYHCAKIDADTASRGSADQPR